MILLNPDDFYVKLLYVEILLIIWLRLCFSRFRNGIEIYLEIAIYESRNWNRLEKLIWLRLFVHSEMELKSIWKLHYIWILGIEID